MGLIRPTKVDVGKGPGKRKRHKKQIDDSNSRVGMKQVKLSLAMLVRW